MPGYEPRGSVQLRSNEVAPYISQLPAGYELRRSGARMDVYNIVEMVPDVVAVNPDDPWSAEKREPTEEERAKFAADLAAIRETLDTLTAEAAGLPYLSQKAMFENDPAALRALTTRKTALPAEIDAVRLHLYQTKLRALYAEKAHWRAELPRKRRRCGEAKPGTKERDEFCRDADIYAGNGDPSGQFSFVRESLDGLRARMGPG